jgi:hypothetical protein
MIADGNDVAADGPASWCRRPTLALLRRTGMLWSQEIQRRWDERCLVAQRHWRHDLRFRRVAAEESKKRGQHHGKRHQQ